MTNIELLKVVRDVLIVAVEVMENQLDDCDANEPNTVCPVHDLWAMKQDRELSVRSCHCLLRAGFTTLEDVVDKMEGVKDLHRIRHMGPHSVAEVLKVAHELGLKWKCHGIPNFQTFGNLKPCGAARLNR